MDRNDIGNVSQYDESALNMNGLGKGIYILHVSGKDSVSKNKKNSFVKSMIPKVISQKKAIFAMYKRNK